jgi:hypothetical protein
MLTPNVTENTPVILAHIRPLGQRESVMASIIAVPEGKTHRPGLDYPRLKSRSSSR